MEETSRGPLPAGGDAPTPGGPDDGGNASTLAGLRRFNAIMAVFHLAQGIVLILLSTDFSLPVTSSFLKFDAVANKLVAAPDEIASLPLAPMIAGFLFISAAAHAAVSSPWFFPWYARNLRKGVNYARWIEYSVSASVMIVVIAMLVGIYDIASLILIFAVNASMILFGWLMELHNQTTGETDWTSFWFGTFAGTIPWVVIAVYLIGSGSGEGGPPGFVYGIFGSIFVFFNVFAINMVLQYKKIGPWRDYLFGERAYIILSLTSKSILAWQVFAGTLRPV
ncbi:MAG: heliorhodopsin HeR [Chloroflexi bacterium]|nr:heliorhodopsin HeR [Chloroflexota bacterium]MDA1269960.1 heliorhodopsin HeR [Chloroflexota bacterium]